MTALARCSFCDAPREHVQGMVQRRGTATAICSDCTVIVVQWLIAGTDDLPEPVEALPPPRPIAPPAACLEAAE